MRTLLIMLIVAATVTAASRVESKVVQYKVGNTTCNGWVYWDVSAKEKRPGVLVFHEWWGLNEYAKKRAEMLAHEGYVAFCADMYGDGKTTEHPDDAKKFAGEVRAKKEMWMARASEALKTLEGLPEVDKTKIAAIGYCFGGTTAMLLGFTGANVKGVAVFHAGLPEIKADEAKKFEGKLQIHHGAADSFIPDDKVKAFRKILDDAKVKYEFMAYPGATHSFTVEGVDKKLPQLKYDPEADKKSWESMLALFKDTLK